MTKNSSGQLHSHMGEQYVYDRSRYSPKKPDKAGNPSSWIKAMLTSHIKFVLHCIP